jgi:hypothetical protein
VDYSDNSIVTYTDLCPYVKYFTRKVTGLFLFAADLNYLPMSFTYLYVNDKSGANFEGICVSGNGYFTF